MVDAAQVRFRHDERDENQEEVFGFLADPATHGGAEGHADRHARGLRVPRRRPCPQGQARGALSLPRLLDAGASASRRARPSSRSTRPTRRKSTAASSRSRARPTAGSRSAATVTPVEWAVEMRRFDEKRTLDHLAGGKIDDALADALGRAVAAAHANGARGRGRALDRGDRPLYRRARRGVRRSTRDVFPPPAVDALARASRAAYERIVPLLARARRGAGSSAASTAICISAISC